jgi:hypothetical protein
MSWARHVLCAGWREGLILAKVIRPALVMQAMDSSVKLPEIFTKGRPKDARRKQRAMVRAGAAGAVHP